MIKVLLKFSFFLFVATIICINGLSSSASENAGDVRCFMRVINTTTLGPLDESLIMEVKWATREFTQYYTATFKIIRTYVLRRIVIQFERCRDLEMGCENFQTWNFTQFCFGLMMKNQMWSPIISSIKPKTLFQNCPRVNQGVYKFDNVSFDLDPILKFYNEAHKYYWKIYSWFYNSKNEIEVKGFIHLFFTKYTKRNRNRVNDRANQKINGW